MPKPLPINEKISQSLAHLDTLRARLRKERTTEVATVTTAIAQLDALTATLTVLERKFAVSV